MVTKPDKTSYQLLMACYSLLPYIKLHPIVRYHYLNYQDNISWKQFETCLPATAVQCAPKHHVTCQVPLKATHTLISQPGTQAKNKTLPPLLHCANGSEQWWFRCQSHNRHVPNVLMITLPSPWARTVSDTFSNTALTRQKKEKWIHQFRFPAEADRRIPGAVFPTTSYAKRGNWKNLVSHIFTPFLTESPDWVFKTSGQKCKPRKFSRYTTLITKGFKF